MPDSSELFFVNQRLEIAPFDSVEYFPSRIECFHNDDIVVAMPARNSLPVYLPVGSVLLGRVRNSAGIMYSFDSMLLEYTMHPIPLWTIKKPESVKRIQQRNFFRYPVSLPVKYFIIDEVSGAPVESTETVVESHNLSGDGVLLLLPENKLSLGVRLWIEIALGKDGEVVSTVGVVVRVDAKSTGDGSMLFYTALRFVNMDELIRKKITNFINGRLTDNDRVILTDRGEM